MSNIIKINEPNNKLTLPNKLGPRKVGLASRVDAAREQGNLASEVLNFSNVPNRIVLCVDDSGSMRRNMSGQILETKDSRMDTAKKACEAFLSVCNPADTVLGMYTISTNRQHKLSFDYTPLLVGIKAMEATGGTPLYETLDNILNNENVTRVVVISDGASGDISRQADTLMAYKNKVKVIDAVFIGTEDDTRGIEEMKHIAGYTGGIFIHFKNASDFASKFKYLAPAFYGMLTSGEIKL